MLILGMCDKPKSKTSTQENLTLGNLNLPLNKTNQ